MHTEIEMIHVLADGGFHSGEALGHMLGITRATVWKRLQRLKDEFGIGIDAVKGRGYRLRDPLDLINKEELLGHIPAAEGIGSQHLHLHTILDSTNTWLMQRGLEGEPSGAVCLAEYQLAGRGRHGRQWISPFGRNVYLSLLWRFDLAPMQVAGLSLAAAIGVLRALHAFECRDAGLKWPNDILWRNRKLAGLLLEVSGEARGPSQVVIGVGLNTWLGEAGNGIDQPWIDLGSIPNLQPYSRSRLAARLIVELRRVAREYSEEGLPGFLDEWHRHDMMKGKAVEIRSASQRHRGEHLGVDPSGALRLLVDGKQQLFHAGEVSLGWGED
jgi:BirA family transcriptional regulator, biotin operon repressor / biotin---[acetyl-CoA-carboxylase] ligase